MYKYIFSISVTVMMLTDGEHAIFNMSFLVSILAYVVLKSNNTLKFLKWVKNAIKIFTISILIASSIYLVLANCFCVTSTLV